MTTKTVHCQNCDAVFDAKPKRIYLFPHWLTLYPCPYCASVETDPTTLPHRPPKWERTK